MEERNAIILQFLMNLYVGWIFQGYERAFHCATCWFLRIIDNGDLKMAPSTEDFPEELGVFQSYKISSIAFVKSMDQQQGVYGMQSYIGSLVGYVASHAPTNGVARRYCQPTRLIIA